jgi:hypothetical protein
MVYVANSSWYRKIDFERGIADDFYFAAFYTLGLSAFIAAVGAINGESEEKRKISLMLVSLNFIESICFYALRFRHSTAVLDPTLNTPVELARYLEWSYGPTCLIIVIARLTRSTKSVVYPILNWLAMTWLGYLTMLYTQPLSELFLYPALTCWLIATYIIFDMFNEAITGHHPKLTRGTLRFLQYHFVILWSWYTLVFYGQIKEVLTAPEVECWYAASSIVTKFVFTAVVVASPFRIKSSSKKTE